MTKTIIRKARKSDWDAIQGLVLPYLHKEIELPLPAWKSYAVALVNGKIAGCCALQVYSKKIAEIRSLVVAKQIRKKGVGTKLVQFCIEKAERKSIREVMVVTSIPELFKKNGFDYFSSQKHILFKRYK